jgi:N-hydroxyarylamine O-acetyltransferase
MELDGYLARLGLKGRPRPTHEWLRRIHRAHHEAIPYENLDVALGRPIPLDPAAAYAKLVVGGRGGWCYEMNGLLAWALQAAGFAVDHLAATVRRQITDTSIAGNHLALRVTLDGPHLADVGFGDGLIEPMPLQSGTVQQEGLDFGLEREGDRWVFRNQAHGGAPAFDFAPVPVERAWFATPSHTLQTSPESPFRRTTVCQRLVGRRYLTLRGAVLRWSGEASTRVIGSAGEYTDTLAERFGLSDPAFASLWPMVWDRHEAWQARERA